MPEQNSEEPSCGCRWGGLSFCFINFISSYVYLSNVLSLFALDAICLHLIFLIKCENESS
ncbi:hypothetical protein FOL54_02940 [Bartonella quintana]|nr:hypothetical protein FOL54_02940 [Bartonella quintana]